MLTRYRSTYFWLPDVPGQAVSGYGFDRPAGEALAASGSASAQMTWQVALPDPVLAVAAPDPTEVIQSSVKVGGGGLLRVVGSGSVKVCACRGMSPLWCGSVMYVCVCVCVW